MNVAFPALVTFILLLPGFILRSRFKRTERTTLDYSPFGQIAIEGVIWAAAAHIVWLGLTNTIARQYFDPLVLLKLLESEPNGQIFAIDAVGKSFVQISEYFVSLLIACFLVPLLVRIIVSHFKLDRDDQFWALIFRFNKAPWYYLLTGADFLSGEEPDFIVLTAIVDVAGEAIIFSGVLEEFFIDSDGQLDRLILSTVIRRPLSKDKSADEPQGRYDSTRFYSIDGDYFVLRYSETITLNVEYIKLNEAETQPSESPSNIDPTG